MKHIHITERGSWLGVHGERLLVKQENEIIYEVPFTRIKSINVCKEGVSLSSNLVLECAVRGIRLFFMDFRGVAVCGLHSQADHAVCNVRKKQFEFIEKHDSRKLAALLIAGKIHNQRALILYFGKKLAPEDPLRAQVSLYADSLSAVFDQVNHEDWLNTEDAWRVKLLGFEGQAAKLYWKALSVCGWLPGTFLFREGRNSSELVNQSLNFGYAILTSVIWQALLNAGLELYAGILHTVRPGKPSLVLDVMEEYRAWVVDRVIIKNKMWLEKETELTPAIKKRIIEDIHEILATEYPYRGKKMKLENIIQRQVYRMSAHFIGDKKYKPYYFIW